MTRTSVLTIAVSLLICTQLFGQGEVLLNQRIQHDGRRRNYHLYVPSSYDPSQPMPLVLDFHGFTSNAGEQMSTTGMNSIAEKEGFLVAYPNAISGDWTLTEDHGLSFTDAVLDTIDNSYAVDATRVYATGMSQGGMMSYLLGAARPNTFAAVASVTGTRPLSGEPNLFPSFVANIPDRSMPLMHVHGTADPLVPYLGGNSGIPGSDIVFPSVESVMSEWAANNGCGDLGPETKLENIYLDDNSTVSVFQYQDCGKYVGASGAELIAEAIHYRVNDGGHSWSVPESLRPGFTVETAGEYAFLFPINSDINASQEVWNFFSRHELPVSVPEPSSATLALFTMLAALSLRQSKV